MKNIKIVGIVGSLREESYNHFSLMALKDFFKENITFEILDIKSIPFFNEDLEENIPEEVVDFKEKIANANAVIIVAPEYNFSIPGVLKNALDWASRPSYPFDGKVVAIMSASLSVLGGVRMQYHLRQVLLAMNANVLNRPEVFISSCNEKFDNNGKLIDEKTKQVLKKFVDNLIENIEN